MDLINNEEISCAEDLRTRLRNIRHVALDMDGTIYKGSTLFPFTISFLNTLKELGIGYSFLTNNPSKSIVDYLEHLNKMGITATREEMYTTAVATIEYLQNNFPEVKRLFILGTSSMINEFQDAGFVSVEDDPNDVPDAVVVGFDKSLTYSRLCRAAWWISRGMQYVATNPDKVCPTDQPVILVDCGSICACLEHATGKVPDIVIGKPDPRMLDGIKLRYQLPSSEIAMIGDRIYTDIKMAHDAKALGVLVLTGETKIEDVKDSNVKPDIVAESLTEFLEMLIESRE